MSTITPNGISFDGLHSYTDFGLWLVARPDTGSPQPKLNRVEVPGMDGIIDMTEINAGEVKFSNRTMVFRFAGKVDINDQAAFKTKIMDALHGKRIEKIILDEDSLWYYSGRVTVQFPESKPWKVYCTITVDADPYAMRNNLHSVSLLPSTHTIEQQSVKLADDDSAQLYVSNFSLGTRVFPVGFDASFGFTQFSIVWDASATWWDGPKQIEVYDATGHYLWKTVDPFRLDYSVSVTFVELTQAGLDLTKIYRVQIVGIGGCTLTVEADLAHIEVQNERKPVVPGFYMRANEAVKIMVNGETFEIPPGRYQDAKIMLHGGTNDVYIGANESANITFFAMSFRGGKL